MITTTNARLVIDDVTDVVVTEIVEVDGVATRAVRIFGPKTTASTPPILEVIIRADEREGIELTAPELNY